MAHLEDRLAEFFYGELSHADMIEAKRHVAECADCRLRLEQFSKIDGVLRTAAEVEPPRHVVFTPPERRVWAPWFDLRWAMTGSAAALLVAAIVIGTAFRTAPVSAPAPTSASAPVVLEAEKVDYNRIVNEVRDSQRAWVEQELVKRDQEIQRLRGELAYYENFQRAVVKETLENGSAIQLLAQRVDFQR